MTKTMLIVVIGAAVLAVGAIGAVTATVIVKNGGGGARMVQVAPAQLAPAPAPGRRMPPLGRRGGHGERGFGPGSGPLPGMRGMHGLRDCLEQHGLGGSGKRGTLPDLRTMRGALKACRGSLPGRAPLR